MALHSRAQFAELCGIAGKSAPAIISMNIQRGKIVPTGKLIDDLNQINKTFLESQRRRKAVKALHVQPPSLDDIEVVDPGEDREEAPKNKKIKVVPDVDPSTLRKFELDNEIKEVSLKKANEELQLLQARNEKIKGLVMPKELVKLMLAQHSKSLLAAFKNSIDEVLTNFSKKRGLSGEERAEIRGKLTDVINNAMEESVDLSKKNIKQVIEDYSKSRGIGERQ